MARLALRASASTSSVRYSGLPAAPPASRLRSSLGLPRASSPRSWITASSVSPSSWRRVRPAICRSASRSSRCGTGRIIPISSSGISRAARAIRSHSVTLVRSAHCRSSTTRITGRIAHSSSVSASNCSASAAAMSSPRPDASSPRSRARMDFRRGLSDGSRTRSPSRNGTSGNACPSSSPAPQNTWQPRRAASPDAAPARAVLPIPGSPSISTAWPRPAVASLTRRTSRVNSWSRPTSRPPGAESGTRWIVPRGYRPEQALSPRLGPEQEDHFLPCGPDVPPGFVNRNHLSRRLRNCVKQFPGARGRPLTGCRPELSLSFCDLLFTCS